MEKSKEDKEIKAISDIISSLADLDAVARERVLKYVGERLGVSVPTTSRVQAQIPTTEPGSSQAVLQPSESITDIRTLKEQKGPESAIQMAALVAYYLQEVAGMEERKDSIDVDDLKTYFKQAGFPLPKVPKNALVNSKNAGYLESADRGRYRLNPVGYNLIAYGLPAKTRTTNAKRPRTKKTKTTKPTKTTKSQKAKK